MIIILVPKYEESHCCTQIKLNNFFSISANLPILFNSFHQCGYFENVLLLPLTFEDGSTFQELWILKLVTWIKWCHFSDEQIYGTFA